VALAAALLLAGCAHRSAARLGRTPPATHPLLAVAAPPAGESEQAGVFHVIRAGETLYSIARLSGVPLAVLARENRIADPAVVDEGRAIFIPAASRPQASSAAPDPASGVRRARQPLARIARTMPRTLDPAARGVSLTWPVRGVLFSSFGPRARDQHDGIDLAAPEGTPVLAAASGTVLFAGEKRGYGKIVLVAHRGDVVTVYAHNSENLARPGDQVHEGAAIARVGHTGNATGPHLHFEVRVASRPHDPLGFLR
jgi:murein DD-endopeptidase MepM/ murein hydrolase activator NlpD